MTSLKRALACAIAVNAALAWAAAPALATESIDSFSSTISTTTAGAHPDIGTSFALHSPGAPEAARNVIFEAPEGVFGNPGAITRCTSADFAQEACPSSSQAGLITVHASYGGDPDDLLGTAPIYNLTPGEDQTALLAFIVPVLDIPINIPVAVRTGTDYGLRFTVADITQLTPLASVDMTLWGFPAKASHDAERFPKGSAGNPAGCPGRADAGCLAHSTPAAISVHPFTDNPTSCTGEPLVTTLEVQTYQDPEHLSSAHSSYPPTTACDTETFKPVLYASPTTEETDSASGLNIELSDPQPLGFAATPAELHSATVTLPEGLTINPDAADGQTACSDADAHFGTEGPANCPDSAKIGTAAVHSTALEGALEGSIYIGEPLPGDQYRAFLIVDGFGLHAKFVGSFRPDPTTGQVTIHFDELPQVPFDSFDVHLFASDRGLVATPSSCALYTTNADFVAWNATLPDEQSNQIFTLTSGPGEAECPGPVRPFHPHLEAGTQSAVSGASSSFALRLNREDGDQFLGKLNFTMPPGLTADLHGITYCPEADIRAAANTLGKVEQADPSCPASSEIGTSNVAAGPGGHPFHAVGKVYFAGPFQGAPLSLVAVTPALAGPYDYGTVVVRVALHIDERDAHVVADSETVPSIIGGIPIRMREIEVNVNRPHFMINPTNCSPFTVGSEGIGDQGTAGAFSSYFQVVNCARLRFKPKMSITQLGGRKATKRASDPSIRFDLNARPGDANLKSVAVTLPNALEIDQNHLGNICAKSELEKTHCAGRQPIGAVKDETPLLEHPLEGLAYAVSGYSGLPHVAFILDGQVMVVPKGESKTVGNGRLQTTVPIVPDVPIGHFRLTLYGSKQGYLSNTRNLCKHPPAATVEYAAQNGKTLTQKAPIQTPCGSKGKRHKRRHR